MADRIRNDAPIGVFDSGLGGLTVAREIMRLTPNERIVYFGDTARVPYGSKSKSTIIHYTEQILNFLKTREVKALVIACNTMTAYAMEEVKPLVDVPIIGVVKPGAKVACQNTVNKRIGVIGTEGTVNSGMYMRLIGEISPEAIVYQKACPLFCPLVEAGMWNDEITRLIAERYLKDLREADIDTLIMGCTHYPLLRSVIREVMGGKVQLINPAYETAVELRRTLEHLDLMREEHPVPDTEMHQFFVSDDPDRFENFASSVLHVEVREAKKIDIESF